MRDYEKKFKKNKHIAVRLYECELNKIKEIAKKENLSLSKLLRIHILNTLLKDFFN